MDGYYGDHPALELINSEYWYGRRPHGGADLLDQPGWLDGYLSRWALAGVQPPSARERAEIETLRVLLRRAYTALGEGQRLAADDLRTLNGFLAAGRVQRAAREDEGTYVVELTPVVRDWRWVLSEVAASFLALVETGERARMKLCENGECLCAFYDESKNRRRRWCYPHVCGNLHKVRAFRERQRAARASGDGQNRRSTRTEQGETVKLTPKEDGSCL